MKKTHIIGIIVIALAIGAIISTINDAGTYVTFAQARQHPDMEFTVIGELNKSRDITYDPEVNVNLFSFYVIDKDGDEQKIIFHGTKPQDFERSEQITLQGKMVDGTFICTKILMKCPSKYNDGKEEVEIRSIES
ncbi:MAG TPA: cytochrome c maturation protein CcmE [Flavobacteriales bacterium]|nr:cytochrome c maturation protein CcmE [Flavobacteriales bacterium]HIO68032.1 cytochrome c maturation protein CcmE [Flavobacteriales bacterium]